MKTLLIAVIVLGAIFAFVVYPKYLRPRPTVIRTETKVKITQGDVRFTRDYSGRKDILRVGKRPQYNIHSIVLEDWGQNGQPDFLNVSAYGGYGKWGKIEPHEEEMCNKIWKNETKRLGVYRYLKRDKK